MHHYFRMQIVLKGAPPPPPVLARTFDEQRDTEAVWHLIQGAYAGVEAARDRSRDSGRPAWTSPAGTRRSGLAARRQGHRPVAALGEKGSGPEALGDRHLARRRPPPAARGHGRTLLLLRPTRSGPAPALRRSRGARQHGGRGARVRVGRHDARPAGGALGEGHRCLSWTSSPRAPARRGRLGIDTEFMPEGRYRPLLCLVQVCVGEEVVVLDPMNGDLDAPAARGGARRPGGRGRTARRPPGRRDPAPRTWGTTFANVFDTRVAAVARLLRAGGLHRPAARRAPDPALQVGLVHALGRLLAEQLRYAREDVEHLLPWRTSCSGG